MQSSDIRCNSDGALTQTVPEDIVSEFWQQWQELQDPLYRCCLKLMNFNSTDAEDALSQAMLKAWEKVQKYAEKIDNLKAWLMQLTRNLCIDTIRQRSLGAAGVESLEWVGATENIETAIAVDTPEKALETEEKATVIKQAIASLPERLRNSFILHFYQQRTHTEIAEEQGITYDNVCKRISLARKLLKEKLSGYFRGTDREVATVGSLMWSTPGETTEKLQKRELDAKKALDSEITLLEGKAVESTSTPASADLNTPDLTLVHAPSAQSGAKGTEGVAANSIAIPPRNQKLVGDGDSNGQNLEGIKELKGVSSSNPNPPKVIAFLKRRWLVFTFGTGERNFAWDLNSPCLERLRVWSVCLLISPRLFSLTPLGL
ncbi:MAG: sigma-70 family RNA polymerase sigma factor [Symploca sp. SIO1C4]|uniref:Sigma-70 family RNA polymerase sigma factor n=1 Tax=Symploca sp. SIO1C4 TaxID=2607765 RepID=A0A6B3N1B8_9CYAN|nr:sigma-70 family RNA polymerase sigma factor [Symploca sp. SIO1C4]